MNVARVQQRREVTKRQIDDCRRHHQPDRAEPANLGNQLILRRGPRGTVLDETSDSRRLHVLNHARVTIPEQAPNHAGTHSPQSGHAELHPASLSIQNERRWVAMTWAHRRNRHALILRYRPARAAVRTRTKPNSKAINSWQRSVCTVRQVRVTRLCVDALSAARRAMAQAAVSTGSNQSYSFLTTA